MHPVRKTAAERGECRPGRRPRTGLHQVGDGFGLGKIKPAVEKSAFAEFPGPGMPRPVSQHGGEQFIEYHRGPVRVDFYHVFPREGARAREIKHQPLVQDEPLAITQ